MIAYVEDAAYEGFLLVVEGDASGGFYIGVFDIEVVWCLGLLAMYGIITTLRGSYLMPFYRFERLKWV